MRCRRKQIGRREPPELKHFDNIIVSVCPRPLACTHLWPGRSWCWPRCCRSSCRSSAGRGCPSARSPRPEHAAGHFQYHQKSLYCKSTGKSTWCSILKKGDHRIKCVDNFCIKAKQPKGGSPKFAFERKCRIRFTRENSLIQIQIIYPKSYPISYPPEVCQRRLSCSSPRWWWCRDCWSASRTGRGW